MENLTRKDKEKKRKRTKQGQNREKEKKKTIKEGMKTSKRGIIKRQKKGRQETREEKCRFKKKKEREKESKKRKKRKRNLLKFKPIHFFNCSLLFHRESPR
jgi:hypothetical protein